MSKKLLLVYAFLLFLAVFGAIYIIWALNYYEQVEYEANHPLFPIQINDTAQSVYYNGSIYTAVNYTRSYNIYFAEDIYTMFEIRPLNGSDYTNSDIEINKSYIKSITPDEKNNTMIISIRKE